MRAYVYDNGDSADQRAPHDLGIEKSKEDLEKIGVFYSRIEGIDALDKIDEIAKERNYQGRDTIVVSPDAMGPDYEKKVNSFFAEHLHEDEEIRYVLDGSGYFDVRDADDVWIRIYADQGDMLILPSGIYHRFTTDEKNYIKAMRLFKEKPKWEACNRPDVTADNKCRDDYVKSIQSRER